MTTEAQHGSAATKKRFTTEDTEITEKTLRWVENGEVNISHDVGVGNARNRRSRKRFCTIVVQRKEFAGRKKAQKAQKGGAAKMHKRAQVRRNPIWRQSREKLVN